MPFYDGLNYPFVLDAILALTALHKALKEPQNGEKYISACLYYQSQCLRVYQDQLSDINLDNCHAVYAVSVLISVITIAMSCGSSALLPTPPLETLFTTFELLRGIQAVLSTTYDTLRTAHYKDVFAIPPIPPDAVVSPEVSHAMEKLLRLATNETSPADPSHLDVYKSSIETLEEHFTQVEQVKNFGAIIA
jgi:hypothetical protein